MLKRLELIGFKSFADKTRFDFAPGITGVVGPNGSGKSNVVDAVRWILGEQSAKSLRGGEMADVIFNGSSSRKSFGMAEVTVVFDNTRRLLALDADEVQLTRRVYRDGTGEYLINGETARLKDFKEMFLGSGAGSGGYTIIAQGRVDELLQASTKDRREIFDEAAGISRFKAKKTETLRKLAVAEANVTRSNDRLDGLDSQLRTLRMQAAKAQKFQEYSDRLRELRVGLSVREYREFRVVLEAEQRILAELQGDVAGATRQTSELERALRELDREVARSEDSLRHHEGRLADARQQIAGFDATLKHERTATAAHEAELLKLGRQRAELGYRTKAVEAETARAAAENALVEEQLATVQRAADAATASLTAATNRVADLEREAHADRERQYERVAEAAAARTTATTALAQVERLQKEYTRKRGEIEHNIARRGALAAALDGLSRAGADVQARLAAARDHLAATHGSRDGLIDRIGRVQTSLEGLRVRQGDLRGRIGVLEELERTLDGLGAGVRLVLGRWKADCMAADENPPFSTQYSVLSTAIVGLVADLLTVPHEIAPLVELALGDVAQRFVVRSPDSVDAIAASIGDVPGRVGFLPVVRPDPPTAFPTKEGGIQSSAPPEGGAASGDGSLLASQVSCELASLPEQLLGNVLLADSLPQARRLAMLHPRCRFVTRVGELLEPDGTLTIGPPRAGAGLVSRKSELRELREQFRALSEQVTITELELAELRRQGDMAEGIIEAVEAEIAMLSGEAGELQQKIARQHQQVEQIDEMVELLRQESGHLEEEVQHGETEWLTAKLQAEEAERSSEELKAKLAGLVDAARAAEAARDAAQEAHTTAQVALSRAAADRDRTRERVAQLDSELRKRRIEAVDIAATHRTARDRLAESTLAMLRASAGQADAYREKEYREHLAHELGAKAAADRMARERVRDDLHALRTGWQERQNQAHAKELAVHDIQARQNAIAGRIREDYGIELADVIDDVESSEQGEPATEAPSPTAEIEDLKRKLARLGSVNLEALDELNRIETEFNHLKAQHEDLAEARKKLQDVIDAINTDSRKLFTETLTAVRGYFQELFRKLFGGGQADIVLEDEADVLECGIEITARPPGKELRALSLLSGGEKTLTAVALLLAIFRNKPSPFCVLDEVDAALDEANTNRLAGVLREFLDRSQFIVVTHKKRTMASVDRLWGVTMQESGVSRLLPMRFEDWPDEEQPALAAA